MVILIFFVTYLNGYSQKIDSLITGNWFEVYKKRNGYYLPLEVSLQNNNVARYINRYPEGSYNLKYYVCTDSTLGFSDGNIFKILFISQNSLKLKRLNKNNSTIITLKKAAQLH